MSKTTYRLANLLQGNRRQVKSNYSSSNNNERACYLFAREMIYANSDGANNNDKSTPGGQGRRG